jgi:hypothetical protein
MEWPQMAVTYLALLLDVDPGEMKKVARRMRKNTTDWHVQTWQEWRAAGMGVARMNTGERRIKLLQCWQATRRILGADYTNNCGRRMVPAMAMSRFTWVRTGQLLREWLSKDARALATARLASGEAEMTDAETLHQIGIHLEEPDEDEPDEEQDEETKVKRTWDQSESGRMRTAKELRTAADVDVSTRAAAAAWCDARLSTGTQTRKGKKPTKQQQQRQATGGRGDARGGCAAAARVAPSTDQTTGGGGNSAEEQRITEAILAQMEQQQADDKENRDDEKAKQKRKERGNADDIHDGSDDDGAIADIQRQGVTVTRTLQGRATTKAKTKVQHDTTATSNDSDDDEIIDVVDDAEMSE